MAHKSNGMRRSSRKEYFQKAVRKYMEVFGVTEVDPDDVARWMCDTRMYEETPYSVVRRCKKELTDAMREEHAEDPQGRTPRQMHCVRYKSVDGELKSTWSTLFDATPTHMRVSLQQRRRSIRGQVLQHHTDLDSYNDNNKHGAHVDLFDYDFNKDVAEHEMPTDYPDVNPEGGDETPPPPPAGRPTE